MTLLCCSTSSSERAKNKIKHKSERKKKIYWSNILPRKIVTMFLAVKTGNLTHIANAYRLCDKGCYIYVIFTKRKVRVSEFQVIANLTTGSVAGGAKFSAENIISEYSKIPYGDFYLKPGYSHSIFLTVVDADANILQSNIYIPGNRSVIISEEGALKFQNRGPNIWLDIHNVNHRPTKIQMKGERFTSQQHVFRWGSNRALAASNLVPATSLSIFRDNGSTTHFEHTDAPDGLPLIDEDDDEGIVLMSRELDSSFDDVSKMKSTEKTLSNRMILIDISDSKSDIFQSCESVL